MKLFSGAARFMAAAAVLAAMTALPWQSLAATGSSLSPPAGALVAPGDQPSVIVMYTGDVMGYVDPCG